MDIIKYQKKLKALPKELEKKVLKNPIVTDLIVKTIKSNLSEGENAEGEIIGVYTKFTETIAKNPELYGVVNPIKPKLEGEPYNLEWSGAFFDSIIAKFKEFVKYEVTAESPFLDGRDENKIINIQEEQRGLIVEAIQEVYSQFIKSYFR